MPAAMPERRTRAYRSHRVGYMLSSCATCIGFWVQAEMVPSILHVGFGQTLELCACEPGRGEEPAKLFFAERMDARKVSVKLRWRLSPRVEIEASVCLSCRWSLDKIATASVGFERFLVCTGCGIGCCSVGWQCGGI